MNLLINKKILVTKTKKESELSLLRLVNEGAEIIYFPTIKIIPSIGTDEVKEIFSKAYDFDYLVFTSANAAEIFAQAEKLYKPDFSKTKIAVVGKSTAEKCGKLGIYVHLIPDEYSAKGLLKKFSELNIAGKKILIPCSSLSRDELSAGLSGQGALVSTLKIYNVVQNDIHDLQTEYETITTNKPDIFVFTSPSSFSNFLALMNTKNALTYFEKSLICAIGTTTESAIREAGLVVHVVPDTFSLHGVGEAIIKYFQVTANIA
ncbi:MAG: uroporphyrinogen-III synthase [Ignavibacteriales bacterium]|nr:uroporphyrinogen-III synthase [Ignavibacteriales bacterium]